MIYIVVVLPLGSLFVYNGPERLIEFPVICLTHAGMLDHVNVMSNGVQTPLAHVAAVSVSNLETLTVMPYDPSVSVLLYFRN